MAITRDQALAALKRTKGNVTAAGRLLGVGERVIRYWRDQPASDPIKLAAAREEASREAASTRSLVEEVRILREQVKAQAAITARPLAPIKAARVMGGTRRQCVALAMLSDLHVEETVRPDETPTGNSYNLAIADLRLSRAFSGVEWQIKAAREWADVNTLILNLNGDLISGHIHPELQEGNSLAPVQAIGWLYPRLMRGINGLAQLVERIDIVCEYGNHGRDTMKPRRATGAAHSYEWGMYQRLACDLAGRDGLSVHAPESAHAYHRAFDWDLHFHHGDEIRYAGGVGGIHIPIRKAVDAWNDVRRCHYHFFGHWHQYVPGPITVNGSLIGYNAFAMSIKARPEPPTQAFCLIDSKRGMTGMAPLWVSDPSAERKLIAA